MKIFLQLTFYFRWQTMELYHLLEQLCAEQHKHIITSSFLPNLGSYFHWFCGLNYMNFKKPPKNQQQPPIFSLF